MKKSTLAIVVLFYTTLLSAQSTSSKRFALLDNSNLPRGGFLESVTASLQTSLVQPALTKKEMIPLRESVVKNAKTELPAGKTTLPEAKTNSNVFEIRGATSTARFTSIQAKFGFEGLARDTVNMELYRMEKKGDNRIFSVIPGITQAVSIPIYFLSGPDANGGGARSVVPAGINMVRIPSGYLSPGEYIFIDKGTVNSTGSEIKGYAFTIL